MNGIGNIRKSFNMINNIRTEDWEGKCQLCGNEDELRPYGLKGENICFGCGMKNKEATEKVFDNMLSSSELTIIDTRKS